MEGNDDKNKDACTNGASGDGERLTATDGCDTSSTKRKGATTPHDCVNAETNKQKDAGTVSQLIFETPVRNTTVSKNGFSNSEKHGNLTLPKYSTILHRELGISIFTEDTINHPKYPETVPEELRESFIGNKTCHAPILYSLRSRR